MTKKTPDSGPAHKPKAPFRLIETTAAEDIPAKTAVINSLEHFEQLVHGLVACETPLPAQDGTVSLTKARVSSLDQMQLAHRAAPLKTSKSPDEQSLAPMATVETFVPAAKRPRDDQGK